MWYDKDYLLFRLILILTITYSSSYIYHHILHSKLSNAAHCVTASKPANVLFWVLDIHNTYLVFKKVEVNTIITSFLFSNSFRVRFGLCWSNLPQRSCSAVGRQESGLYRGYVRFCSNGLSLCKQQRVISWQHIADTKDNLCGNLVASIPHLLFRQRNLIAGPYPFYNFSLPFLSTWHLLHTSQ